jgi:hypothetical protein
MLAKIARRNRRPAKPVRVEHLENRLLLSATLYVSPTGSDSASGSASAPLATLQHALAIAAAGDTIDLNSGTYGGGTAWVTTSDLTIQSTPGQSATFAVSNENADISFAIDIAANANGVVIRNLNISGGYYYAVKTESTYGTGASSNYGVDGFTLLDDVIHDSGQDVIKLTPGANDVLIEDDQIYNSGMRDPSNAEGIDAVNVDNLTVEGCYIHNIATNGVYAKGGSENTIIEQNLVEDIGYGGILLGQDTDYEWFNATADPNLYENINGVVKNNIVIDTQYAGIGLWATLNAQVLNNTVIDAAQTGQGGIYITDDQHYLPPDYTTGPDTPNVNPIVENNIVSMNNSQPAVFLTSNALSGPATFSHNLYYSSAGAAQFWDDQTGYYGGFAGWQKMIGTDSTSSVANPLLSSTGVPAAGSPALRAGLVIASVTNDYYGHARPVDGPYDIGAIQLSITTPAIPPPAPPTTPPPATTLPAGWTDSNVGSPGKAGSASVSNGKITLTGGGADIWNNSDQFNYAYQSLDGSGTMIVHVDSISDVNIWSKAGLMIRNGSAANAAFVDLVITPSEGVNMQWRTTAGGNCYDAQIYAVSAPTWLKLVRSGNTFTGYVSSNGTTWTKVGSATVAMSTNVLAGVAVTAHNNSDLCTATFDSFSLSTATAVPANAAAESINLL